MIVVALGDITLEELQVYHIASEETMHVEFMYVIRVDCPYNHECRDISNNQIQRAPGLY